MLFRSKHYFMSLWTWLDKEFENLKKKWAASAVAVLETLDPLIQNGGLIAGIEDAISPKLGPVVVAAEQKAIPGLIATGLAIEGLPDNPTAADILTFENNVVKAFGSLTDKSQFKTTFVAQVYGSVHTLLSADPKPTFAQLAEAGEDAYQDYLADKAAETASEQTS